MREPFNRSVLDELIEPIVWCLTPDVAQRIVALRASPRVQKTLDDLAGKSTEGMLTEAERRQYETFNRAINFIGVLQAKARTVIASGTD